VGLNSCLYECVTRHDRFRPKRYGLKHGLFYFYLDLDELDGLSSRLRWVGRRARRW